MAPLDDDEMFSGGYRQWRYGMWNALHDVFEPDRLKAIAEADKEKLEEIDSKGVSDDYEGPELPTVFQPMQASTAVPRANNEAGWVSTDDAIFITAGHMHSARIGGQGTVDGETIEVGKALSPTDHLTLSITNGLSISGGVSLVGVGGSLTRTDNTTKTSVTVRDMNGDGILDVVDSRNIIIGQITRTGQALPPATILNDILPAGRFASRREGVAYSRGDGPNIPVSETTSAGKTQEVSSQMPVGAGGSVAIGRNILAQDLRDMNGDGLPDIVERGPDTEGVLKVRYNLGSHFGNSEVLDTHVVPALRDSFPDIAGGAGSDGNTLRHDTTVTANANLGVATENAEFGVSVNFSASQTRTFVDLVDLNGDGLPDWLYKLPSQDIKVKYNLGGTFSELRTWNTQSWSPDTLGNGFVGKLAAVLPDVLRDIVDRDVLSSSGRLHPESLLSNRDIGFYFTIPIPVWVGFLIINPGYNAGTQIDTHELAFIDINGDGTPDHVARQSGDSSFKVKRNLQTGRSNLLSTIHRPLGGTIHLEYARTANTVDMPSARQVLTSVRVDDGVNLSTGFGSPDIVNTFSYGDGYYDRTEKEFFGFATVTNQRADNVRSVQVFENRDYARKGMLLSQSLSGADGFIHSRAVNTYSTRAVIDQHGDPLQPHPDCLLDLDPRLPDEACASRHVVLESTTTTRHERRSGGNARKVHRVRDLAFDRFGNVLESVDYADDTSGDDDVYAAVSYQNRANTWILGLPEQITVHAWDHTQRQPGAILRSRHGTYTDQGSLASVTIETGVGPAVTTLRYDNYGNVEGVTTPPNQAGDSLSLSYTTETVAHQYPTHIADSFGYHSEASTDLRFGLPLTTTDTNGNTIRRAYDKHGRLEKVWGPYDSDAEPALEMEYHPDGQYPMATTANRASAPADYQGSVPEPLRTVTFVDGLGRPLEVKKSAEVNGRRGMIVQGPPQYDAMGRATDQYHPFFSPSGLAFAFPEETYFTSSSYDDLDRVTTQTFPDKTKLETRRRIVKMGGRWLFETQVVDGNGQTVESYADHAERVLAYVEHPTSGASSITRYAYSPLSELTSVTDAEGNVTSFTYDLAGRQLSMHSPDAGLIEQAFDLMGNRVLLREPNHRAAGTAITYEYDVNRLHRVLYPSKPTVAFEYGAYDATDQSAGRITKITDETGTLETLT